MLFVILGVIIAIAMMCLPIVAMFIVKKEGAKVFKPLAAGMATIFTSTILSAIVLLIYEEAQLDFFKSAPALIIKWLLFGAMEAAALLLAFRIAYKNKISAVDTLAMSAGLCVPMLYSRGFTVIANLLAAAQNGINMPKGWALFYITMPSLVIAFIEPVMVLLLALLVNRGKWAIGAGLYTLMIAIAYNIEEISGMCGGGEVMRIALWLIVIGGAWLAARYALKRLNEFPEQVAKRNGKNTRLKNDKFAWPEDEDVFPEIERPKQMHPEKKQTKTTKKEK